MRRLILAAALVAASFSGAAARAPMETSQLVDDAGVPIGTAGNPLFVSGGGGGGGGTVTQGAAATDSAGNRWPVLAYQGGTWNVGLTGSLPAFAATPTFNLGTLNGAATAANQSTEIAALGAPADAAYAGSGSASLVAALKGVFAAALNPQPLTASYAPETLTALAASAAYTGPTRFGSFGTNGGRFAYYQGKFIADQAGTAFLEVSTDGATFFTAETGALPAGGGTLTLRTPMATAVRLRFVNGATAQTKFYAASHVTAY